MSQISRRHAIAGVVAAGAAVPLVTACGGSDSGSGLKKGTVLTKVSDVPKGGGAILPEQQVVVTQPEPGKFHGFSSICTHQGCPVTDVTDTINCTCHGSKFALTDGSVVAGPAPSPLPAIDVAVDGDSITVA